MSACCPTLVSACAYASVGTQKTHAFMHACTHGLTHALTHTHMHTHTHTHTHVYACIQTDRHASGERTDRAKCEYCQVFQTFLMMAFWDVSNTVFSGGSDDCLSLVSGVSEANYFRAVWWYIGRCLSWWLLETCLVVTVSLSAVSFMFGCSCFTCSCLFLFSVLCWV